MKDVSLLEFLDAPIVVGDPDGRAVYLNPAFEGRFERAGEQATGLPLAELFEGGAREAVLRAVVTACESGSSVRFRVREGQVGYSAVASPIVAEEQRVGVLILLKEEVEGVERLLELHREIQDPLGDLSSALDMLLEQTGGRRNPHHRALVEEGLRALNRLRKWSDELQATLSGAPQAGRAVERFDPGPILRRVAARASRLGEQHGVQVGALVPPSIPEMLGDADRLEAAFARLVEERFEVGTALEQLNVGARVVDYGERRVLFLSVSEHGAQVPPVPFEDSPVTQESIAGLGGHLHGFAHPRVGRTTLVRFSL